MNKLRELREKTGESLTEFALRAGIEPSLLSLIERGKRTNRRNADRLANTVNAPVRVVFPDYDELRKW